VCLRKLLELTANNNNRTRHTDVAGLLHDKEFDCVTENIVRETNTKDVYFFLTARNKAKSHIFHLLLIVFPYHQCLQTA
jgi:hypothetical protein